MALRWAPSSKSCCRRRWSRGGRGLCHVPAPLHMRGPSEETPETSPTDPTPHTEATWPRSTHRVLSLLQTHLSPSNRTRASSVPSGARQLGAHSRPAVHPSTGAAGGGRAAAPPPPCLQGRPHRPMLRSTAHRCPLPAPSPSHVSLSFSFIFTTEM